MNGRRDVLVVDDDPDMIEVIELILREAGYATRTALNGLQALDACAACLPGLIVLDMLMPVMNGWQFAHEFHARYGASAPIVVASAAEHAHSRGDAINAADVLPKPFAVSDLLRVVARHMGAAPPASAP